MKTAVAYLLTALVLLAPAWVPAADEPPAQAASVPPPGEVNSGPLKPVIVEEQMAPEPFDLMTVPEYRLVSHLHEALDPDIYLSAGYYYDADDNPYVEIWYIDEAEVRAVVEAFGEHSVTPRYYSATYSFSDYLRHTKALRDALEPDYFIDYLRERDHIALMVDDRFEDRVQAFIDGYEQGDLFRVVGYGRRTGG